MIVLAVSVAGPNRPSGAVASTAGPPVRAPIDANGNLTADGTRTFEWDAQNQLVAVTLGQNSVTGFYRYSQAGNTVTISGTITAHGPNASNALAQRWQDGINKHWNNNGQHFKYGKCIIKCDFKVKADLNANWWFTASGADSYVYVAPSRNRSWVHDWGIGTVDGSSMRQVGKRHTRRDTSWTWRTTQQPDGASKFGSLEAHDGAAWSACESA